MRKPTVPHYLLMRIEEKARTEKDPEWTLEEISAFAFPRCKTCSGKGEGLRTRDGKREAFACVCAVQAFVLHLHSLGALHAD